MFARMHRVLLFCAIIVLSAGTLRSEPIGYLQRDARIDSMPPMLDGQDKPDLLGTSRFGEDQRLDEAGENEQRELKKGELVGAMLRRYLDLKESEDLASQEIMGNELPEDQYKPIDQLDEMQLRQLTDYLVQSLYRPITLDSPLIVLKEVEDERRPALPIDYDRLRGYSKRAHAYMPYTHKRHRTYANPNYDVCNPSKKDVFQLLSALHDVRQGSKARLINFCHRQRPANSVYMNIRFLGRRRK